MGWIDCGGLVEKSPSVIFASTLGFEPEISGSQPTILTSRPHPWVN